MVNVKTNRDRRSRENKNRRMLGPLMSTVDFSCMQLLLRMKERSMMAKDAEKCVPVHSSPTKAITSQGKGVSCNTIFHELCYHIYIRM